MTDEQIPESWRAALTGVLDTPASLQLGQWLRQEEAAGKQIFPPRSQWWRALELTAPDAVKVVILGQDPYHGAGQAHGLSFSVPDGVKVPPSLANIYKELGSDCGIPRPAHGNLEGWARQGVLLLNTSLSVEAGQAGSHARRGWEAITGAALAAVAASSLPTVFILWGNHAQAAAARIPALDSTGRHLVLKSAHPSPLSAHRGFLGSKPFSRANQFLEAHGRTPIDWRA